jgi:hypothetical protein
MQAPLPQGPAKVETVSVSRIGHNGQRRQLPRQRVADQFQRQIGLALILQMGGQLHLGGPRGILQPFLGKDRAANSADNWPAPRSTTNSSPPGQDCNISEFGCAELRTDAGDQN